MARKPTKASAARKRPAPRRGNAGSAFGYLLLLVLLLLIWVRAAHKPWWDAGVAWTQQALRHGATTPTPQVAPPARTATAAPAGCDAERWRIKVLADTAGGHISADAAQAATIEQLTALPRPADIEADARSAAERQAYRVPALLLRYRQESDQDFDVVLAAPDNPRLTLVAAIPAGRCALNDDHGALFDELREDVTLRFGAAGPDFLVLAAPARVEAVGVGFFDAPQGQSGMAGNGFELHPLLDLRVQ